MRGVRERVGGAKERDKEELSWGICTLGPSGWLAGATVRRSRVVAAAKVDHTEHVTIWASCAMRGPPT